MNNPADIQRNPDDCQRIQEARELLGDEATKMTDEQVQELIDSMTALADIIIDHYISLPPEERAKYRNKPNKDSAPPVPPPAISPPNSTQ